MANVFGLLRLPPMSSRDKDAEILALLHRLPRDVLNRLHLVVRPDTVLRWHRDVAARRYARRSRPPAPGPAAHRALDPRPGVAAGPRESRVGVSPGARRAAGARGEGRRFHRLGDPARRRDRPGA